MPTSNINVYAINSQEHVLKDTSQESYGEASMVHNPITTHNLVMIF